ncbi:hypothetical protein N7478_010594 [Penicillium angulare]|uniref:uncharacterized protein n=1 Tax=Penicillium angulare TaxID=116970 RepID=UPI00253F91B5|nr:uncharacterized protein N7478_010594 [Penicillium angulare]KAJ5267786.1 hypothetical protein N7478_010594 [Penicillium angulare]
MSVVSDAVHKGAYNERTATVQINEQLSEGRGLPQAGLPQGSPLSLILFLFLNADLVQRQIDSQGGAVAFVDDFTAWVTGPTAQSNREGIEAIINESLYWEKRSGATFEAEKIAILHIAPKRRKSDHEPFIIKGQTVVPKDHVKILGLLMETRLKYKEYCKGRVLGSRSSNGAAATSGPVPSNSATAFHIDGGAGHGLRLLCLDARV